MNPYYFRSPYDFYSLIHNCRYICIAIVLFTTPIKATTFFVDASKVNNSGLGTSWITAKKDLQEAILAANKNDSIWVKAGTYYPTRDVFGSGTPSDPRTKTFFFKDSVKIFGGFAGTETAFSQRDFNSNVTILNGDIGISSVASDNCYHVLLSVSYSDASILDGFTITNGNANGSLFMNINGQSVYQNSGGGISNVCSNTKYNNLIIYNNSSSGDGGGLYNFDSKSIYTNQTIFSNTSTGTISNGGGIANISSSVVLLNISVFKNTAAGGGGGGIYNGGNLATITITNAFIATNTALKGGGICDYSVNAALSNVVIYNNTGQLGGGFYEEASVLTIHNVTVVNNIARNPLTFIGHGGGLYSNGSYQTVVNCVFFGNRAINSGNDYYNTFAITSILPGSTNNASDYGPTSTFNIGNGFIDLKSVSANSLFLNPGNVAGADSIFMTADDGFRLISCSPLVNAGITTNPVLPKDILNIPRIGNYDIGAYEYPTNTLSVQISGRDTLFASGNYGFVQWFLNGNAIPGANRNFYIPIQNGTYTAVVSDGSLCSVTSGPIMIKGLDVHSETLVNSIKAFPNPSQGIFKISSPIPLIFCVRDLQGRMIIAPTLGEQANISNFSDGFYWMTIWDTKGVCIKTFKILKSSN